MKKQLLIIIFNLFIAGVMAQPPLKKQIRTASYLQNSLLGSAVASNQKYLNNNNITSVHNSYASTLSYVQKRMGKNIHKGDNSSSPGTIISSRYTSSINQAKQLHYDEFWVSGSIGAGGVVSSNIINSGAVLPFRTEFTWQRRHRRLGFGFGKELYLTPQALANLVLGKSPGITKLYFVYEKFLFRNFPINLGLSSHLGFFSTGDTLNQKNSSTGTTTKSTTGGLFGNIGIVLETGIRPFYLFVRPDIEYQSWSGFHKQIQATVSAGIRLKFLSREEKERRASKKAARHNRKKKK